MTTLTSVLICSELGRASDAAIRRAALICAATGARAEVLHVVDEPGEDIVADLHVDDPALHDKLRAAATRALERQVGRCWPAELPPPSLAVRIGPVTQSICEHVQAHGADLVVTGVRGAGVVRKYFIGTTATRLVRKLKRPVLIVKQSAQAPYKRLLMPVDFSRYAEQSLAYARAITPTARITLMHAYEVPFERMLAYGDPQPMPMRHHLRKARDSANQQLRALALQAGLKPGRYSVLLRHGHAYREVLEAAHASAFDCIAIGKHGHGFFNELLLGSTTEHVILEARTDVLVIPLPD